MELETILPDDVSELKFLLSKTLLITFRVFEKQSACFEPQRIS